MKKFFKFGCLGIIAIFAILVIVMVIDISNDDPKPKETTKSTTNDTVKETTTQPKKEAVQETTNAINWEGKIKEVASSDKTTTEKFDEISKYARDYKTNNDEVKQFGNEIIKEYKDKKYIKDVSNHEYMLTNIFKSQVVDKNVSEKPLKDFAFDFWQNSKYNYRGVENATSSATLANERQMDKALSKMNK
ncbi:MULTISPECIES: hypothetical protein [Bacillus]|uniref:hypothetical protein n=1 Tax=Bacillus TaxID=1386 RepID=UPI0019128BCF|nr:MULTISPECIES: hypothetical protein [Bacillus]MBK5506634.1 hypothetical protein [Bacillus sp. TH12]MBK5515100.1 hypothetical protein [Bacillus sp. TH11]